MDRFENTLVAVNRGVVAATLAVIFTIVFANVIGRYLFGSSFAWVEETARHLMVLGAFCGAGLALREGRLVAISALADMLPAGYGRALLASGQTNKALNALEKSNSIDYRDGSMLRDLAVAYARLGQKGMASLVTAERYALRGRLSDAGIHAKRASDLLPRGSGPWQRAQDVLIASQRAAQQRNR